jgi:CelD/BcsL family acetyltransferase involved in cellulose biosynthesis
LDPSEAGLFTRELIRLNRSRMRSKGETSSLEENAFRSFLCDAIPYMASGGLAWLDTIERNGEVLGSALNFVHGDSVYFYMGGFDDKAKKLRPGTALFALVIQRCIDGGYARYDFLRGSEAYKYRWNAIDRLTHRVTIYPHGPMRGHLTSIVDDLIIAMRKSVRYLRRLAERRG